MLRTSAEVHRAKLVLATLGALGFLAFIFFVISLLKLAFKLLRNYDSLTVGMALSVLVLAYLPHLTEYLKHTEQSGFGASSTSEQLRGMKSTLQQLTGANEA